MSLGNIYLFENKNIDEALIYYEKASKYATNYPKYKSYFLLHVAYANYLLKRYQYSYDATKEAVNIYPELSLAHYHHSRYCARLCRIEEALKHLRVAINTDRFYCLKVDSDKDFSNKDFKRMNDKLNKFFEDLQIEADMNARKELAGASNLIDNAVLHGVADETQSLKILELSKKKLNEGKELIIKKKYFASRDAIYKAYTSKKLAVDSLINYLDIQIDNLQNDYNNCENRYLKAKGNFERVFGEYPLSRSLVHKDIIDIILSILLDSIIIYLTIYYYNLTKSSLSNIFPFLIFGFISICSTLYILFHILGEILEYKNKNKIGIYETQLGSIKEDLDKVLKAKNEAVLEKKKLYIDNWAENLNAKDYEKYLIKKFG